MLFTEGSQMNTLILKTAEEEELWKNIAIAVASSSNVTNKESMKYWADKAIEYYRERKIK